LSKLTIPVSKEVDLFVRTIIGAGSFIGAVTLIALALTSATALNPIALLLFLVGVDQVTDIVTAIRGYESKKLAILSALPEGFVGAVAMWILSYVAIPYYMATGNIVYLLLALAMSLVFISSVLELMYVLHILAANRRRSCVGAVMRYV